MDKEKKSEIMAELINELQYPFDEKLLGSYAELEKKYKSELDYQAKKGTGQFYKKEYYVTKYIRDKVKFIFSRLEATVSAEVLNCASNEEIITVIKFLLGLKDEHFDMFFRKTSNAQNGLRRLNTVIWKGSLVYDYEALFVYLVNKWNLESDTEVQQYVVGSVLSHCEILEVLKIIKEELRIAICDMNRKTIYQHFNKIALCYEHILSEVEKNECLSRQHMDSKSPMLLRAVMILDFLMGFHRDLLLIISSVLDDEDRHKIVKFYTDNTTRLLKNANTRDINYSVFENYLIANIFYALSRERLDWIDIQTFLTAEITEAVQPVTETKFIREKVEENIETIKKWFQNIRTMEFGSDEKVLLSSIYKECYLYTNRPEDIFGVEGFLNYIKKGTNQYNGNMPYEELFYYEKILRGIFREKSQLDDYAKQKMLIKEVYLMESAFFSRRNLSGLYIGRCSKVLCNVMKETLKETYRILLIKMPLD